MSGQARKDQRPATPAVALAVPAAGIMAGGASTRSQYGRLKQMSAAVRSLAAVSAHRLTLSQLAWDINLVVRG